MQVIEVEHLHKRYGDTVAVEDVSFTVERGEIFGILGPNGAGKTTTVECLQGLRTFDRGEVRVLGLDPQRERARLRQVVGSQLQESKLPDDLTVNEAINMYRRFYPRSQRVDSDRLMHDLGLTEKRNTRFQHLSGGQAQRLSIALALVGSPRIAILDELTTGLDPQARRDTWKLVERIRDSGVTVVLVTHFMDEAEYLCDRIAIIDQGQIAAVDTPTGLMARGGGDQLHIKTAVDFDLAILRDLNEVDAVHKDADTVVVSGAGNLLHVVTATLLRHDVVVTDSQVKRSSLDDAFVTLTGKRHETSELETSQ